MLKLKHINLAYYTEKHFWLEMDESNFLVKFINILIEITEFWLIQYL